MAQMITLAGLGGSMRERSHSRAVLEFALEIAAQRGVSTELLDVRDLRLPTFMPDQTVEQYGGQYRPSITQLIDVTRRANIMLWCSPTYHGTVSGVMKNAIDFMELLVHEKPPYLQGKAVGLIGIPDEAALQSMASSVRELRAWLAPTQVAIEYDDFDEELRIDNPRAQRRLARLVDELVGFAQMNEKSD